MPFGVGWTVEAARPESTAGRLWFWPSCPGGAWLQGRQDGGQQFGWRNTAPHLYRRIGPGRDPDHESYASPGTAASRPGEKMEPSGASVPALHHGGVGALEALPQRQRGAT